MKCPGGLFYAYLRVPALWGGTLYAFLRVPALWGGTLYAFLLLYSIAWCQP